MASVLCSLRIQAPRRAALLASLVLVVGLLADLAPGVAAADVLSAQSIGVDSCIGQDACTGATGNIGDNSCNGDHACFGASANIARNSCNGSHACTYFEGRVGRGACIGTDACRDASGNIGAHSCKGTWACMYSTGDIGAGSCVGLQACRQHGSDDTLVPIGDGSCIGDGACWGTGASIGDHSCIGVDACYYLNVAVGDCAHNVPGYTPRACLKDGYLPDGRIRKGRGAFLGNNIYDVNPAWPGRETILATALPGKTVTFGISVQNDSAVYSDSFTIAAAGTTNEGLKVVFLRGTTNITDSIAAGTYATPTLAPGTKHLITAKVKVKLTATISSGAWRLVTITSAGDVTRQDAVRFVVTVAP